ncbi:hypothetical protein ACI8AF_08770 [Blastococcus sp. SYSU D00669]
MDTRYVSRTYRRSGAPERDGKAAAVVDTPVARRLGMPLPVEDGRWIVLLAGFGDESPPVEEAARLAYARSLPSLVIADVMASSEPLGEPATHRFVDDQRRHVERLRRCLDRSGDVDRAFARRSSPRRAGPSPRRGRSRSGGDFVFPDTRGAEPPGTDALNRYLTRATRAAHHDDAVVLRLREVQALVRRPESLLAPGFAVRVLRRGGRAVAMSTSPAEAARR